MRVQKASVRRRRFLLYSKQGCHLDTILTSKIEAPKIVNDHVVRSRLLVQMNQSLDKKMTLVCAPAGYGKTTLASLWAQECEHPVAWVSLDSKDNDLMRFWAYVSSAVVRAYPALGDHLPRLFINKDPSSCDRGLAVFLNEIHRMPDSMALIVDDFHLVVSPHIQSALAYFIQQLPAHFHLILLTRIDPSLPLSRLLAAGQLNKLGMEDLRFSRDEASDFFRRRMNGGAPTAAIDHWVKKTEGWAAGIQLGVLSLKQTPSDGLLQDLSGEDRPVADYLWEEVLGQQPEPVQTFLMRTSLLGRMCAPLCDAITGQQGSQAMLEWIERNQLFLVPLDRRKEWFRYHHLFSDFLLERLKQHESDRISELHAAAASWFAANGFDEEAIEHDLAAGLLNRAAETILRMLPSRIKQEWTTLADWLGVLQDAVLKKYPQLFLTKVFLLCLHGRLADAELMLSEWEALQAEQAGQWPQAQVYRFYADTLVIRNYMATERKQFAAKLASMEEYVMNIREDGLFALVYHKFISVSAIRHNPTVAGRPGLAESFFGRLLRSIEGIRTVGQAICAYGYAEAMYERNRLQEAEHYAGESLKTGVRLGYEGMIVPASILLSRISMAKGDMTTGLRILQEAEDNPVVHMNPYWMNNLKLHRLRIRFDSPDGRQAAIDWMAAYPPKAWSEAEALPDWKFHESLMQARAMIAAEAYEQAIEWLDRLSDQSQANEYIMDKLEIWILKSRACLQMHDLNTAVRHFSEALRLSAPERFIRLFVDEGEPLANLLAEYVRLRQSNHIRGSDGVPMHYVKRLASEHHMAAAHSPVRERKAGSQLMDVAITNTEKKVLKLIQAGLSNAQIAEQLDIGVGTVKTHIHRLYGKLGVRSRFEAIQKGGNLHLDVE